VLLGLLLTAREGQAQAGFVWEYPADLATPTFLFTVQNLATGWSQQTRTLSPCSARERASAPGWTVYCTTIACPAPGTYALTVQAIDGETTTDTSNILRAQFRSTGPDCGYVEEQNIPNPVTEPPAVPPAPAPSPTTPPQVHVPVEPPVVDPLPLPALPPPLATAPVLPYPDPAEPPPTLAPGYRTTIRQLQRRVMHLSRQAARERRALSPEEATEVQTILQDMREVMATRYAAQREARQASRRPRR